MAHKPIGVDFTLTGGGSVYLLTPQTDAGRAWKDQYLPSDAQTLGNGIAVEWRYVNDICNGIMNDGLTVRRVR